MIPTEAIAPVATAASIAAALWCDRRAAARRHDRQVDDVLAARYRRPSIGRVWAGDIHSTADPVRNAPLDTARSYGAGSAVDAFAAHRSGLAGHRSAKGLAAAVTGPVRDTADVLHDASGI